MTSGQPGALPKVSIITVCFNSAATLGDTIASIARQRGEPPEYVVVDGGSTDGTLAIIEAQRTTVTRWVSEPDRGIYDAMNKGIAMCHGDVVGIVNSDDYLADDALEVIARTFADNLEVDVVYGDIRFVDEVRGVSYVGRPSQHLERDKFRGMPIFHPATFIARRVYDELGTYRTDFKVASDYEMVLRLLAARRTFRYVPVVVSNMRTSGISKTNIEQSFREAKAIKVLHGCPPWLAAYYELTSIAKSRLFDVVLGNAILFRAYQAMKARRR